MKVEEEKNTPGEKPLKKRLVRLRANCSLCRRALTSEWRCQTSSRIYQAGYRKRPAVYPFHNARIETATQAAEALRPVGGEFAFLSLAASIIGSGLLAVPSRFWD